MVKIKKSQAFPKPPADKIVIINFQTSFPLSQNSVKKVIQFLLEKSGLYCEEITLHFVGKKRIAKLHAQFFQDPSVTDCITFPLSEPHFMGEIFICPHVAKDYAEKHQTNFLEEIALYVVHGFLHLLGFNDQTPEEKKQMRKEEKKWMQALAKNGIGIKTKKND